MTIITWSAMTLRTTAAPSAARPCPFVQTLRLPILYLFTWESPRHVLLFKQNANYRITENHNIISIFPCAGNIFSISATECMLAEIEELWVFIAA